MPLILVLNAGSSSLKAATFTLDLAATDTVSIAEIGPHARLTHAGKTKPVQAPDHAAALTVILQTLGCSPETLTAAAHRVVHGGPTLTAPCRLSADIIGEIAACAPLAPLHNPPALAAIRALRSLAPALPQTASFDTAFHATNPAEATRFALPDIPATQGLRRFGFHGISYQSLTQALPTQTNQPLPARLLAFHLGNGASACAIKNGQSIATTMGYSPLDGLTMGTRPGSLDPAAVLALADRIGLEQTRILLNHTSGLLALSGTTSDMQALLASPDPRAQFAIHHFCYWAIRHGGSMIAAMGGLDAIAFTGGIGEQAAPIRARITAGLSYLPAPVHIVPAAEERQIARDALTLLG